MNVRVSLHIRVKRARKILFSRSPSRISSAMKSDMRNPAASLLVLSSLHIMDAFCLFICCTFCLFMHLKIYIVFFTMQYLFGGHYSHLIFNL